MTKKAEVGIGSLIIFIAMIFVAAITAGVFIQSADSLQQKALMTSKASQSAVSTRAVVMHISAFDGTEGGVRFFEEQIKLAPGSDAMDLSEAMISLSLSNMSADLSYSPEACDNVTNSSGDGYFTDADNGNGTFTVEYIKSSDSEQAHLKRGEMVKLCFASPRQVGEDEEVEIRFVPDKGSPSTASFVTPDVITKKYVKLYS
ncbi:MAG: archaellin/type IV pilin N-terminal domain-containing protein [Nanobdellota archaeon]